MTDLSATFDYEDDEALQSGRKEKAGSVTTIKDLPSFLQPRERARELGLSALTNAELLALILRTGTVGHPVTEICNEIFRRNGNSFHSLERRTRQDFLEIEGIGETKALQIEVINEIIRRYCSENAIAKTQFTQAKDILDFIQPLIGNLPHEEMWAIYIDHSNRVISKMRISSGSNKATVFDVKIVMRRALLEHADAIVLCHNHPSGNMRPSAQDDDVTRKMKTACQAMGLRMLDHIIVGPYASSGDDAIAAEPNRNYYSYFDNGKL